MCVVLTGQWKDLCAEAGECVPVRPADGEEPHPSGAPRVFDIRTRGRDPITDLYDSVETQLRRSHSRQSTGVRRLTLIS